MKIITLLLTYLLFACSPPSQTDDAQSTTEQSEFATTALQNPVIDECNLVLGFDAWEPYQYVDVGGVVTGLDIELIAGVAQQVGCEITYQQGTWVELLAALKQGDIDMLLGASKTEAREEFAFFSEPYRMEEFALYVRKDDDSLGNYVSLTDAVANGNRIGIVEDYVYGEEVARLLEHPEHSKQFVNAMMGEINVARLLDQEVDGFLEDSFVGATMLRRKALTNFIVEQGLKIQTGNAYVMFSQDAITEPQLAAFNAELKKVKQSDTYSDLMNKYLN